MTKRTVLVAVDDLFFAAKIGAVADACGATVHRAKDRESIISAARELKPRLIIIDLHAGKFDALALARELKADEGFRDAELLGFFSHVQKELQMEAKRAGFTSVMTRSAFTKELANILREKA